MKRMLDMSKEHEIQLQERDSQCQQRLDDLRQKETEKCSYLEKRLDDCSIGSEDCENLVENMQFEVQTCNEKNADLSAALSSYETQTKEYESRLDKKQKECEFNNRKTQDEAFLKGTISVCETILGSNANCEENPTQELLRTINAIRDRNTELELDSETSSENTELCSSKKSAIFEKQFRDRLDKLNHTSQDLWYEYKLFYYAVLFLVLMQPVMALVFAKKISADAVGYIKDTAKEMNDYFNRYVNKSVG